MRPSFLVTVAGRLVAVTSGVMAGHEHVQPPPTRSAPEIDGCPLNRRLPALPSTGPPDASGGGFQLAGTPRRTVRRNRPREGSRRASVIGDDRGAVLRSLRDSTPSSHAPSGPRTSSSLAASRVKAAVIVGRRPPISRAMLSCPNDTGTITRSSSTVSQRSPRCHPYGPRHELASTTTTVVALSDLAWRSWSPRARTKPRNVPGSHSCPRPDRRLTTVAQLRAQLDEVVDALAPTAPAVPLRAVAAVMTYLATHYGRPGEAEATLAEALHEAFGSGQLPPDIDGWLTQRRRSMRAHLRPTGRRGRGVTSTRARRRPSTHRRHDDRSRRAGACAVTPGDPHATLVTRRRKRVDRAFQAVKDMLLAGQVIVIGLS
jgi:hypothetical protein